VRIRDSARVRPERSCAGDGGSARGSRRGPLAPLLHGLFFVAAATQTAIVPLLPRLSHAYGLTPSASALLLAAPGLATLAISMPAGVFADRFGARRVTVFATALMCVAAVAQAVPSYLVLVVGRLAFGLAFGTVWTTGVAWMSSSHDESATPHLGAVATSAAVGMVAGPAIGGVLADHVGLSAPFVFVAVFAAVLAIVLWRQPGDHRSAAASRDIHGLRDVVRVAPRRPGVLAGAIALAIAGAVGGVAQLLVPLGLHRAGFTASATGAAFSAAAGVYIVVSALVIRLGRRATTLRWTSVAALALALSLLPAAIDARAAALVGVLLLSTGPRAVVSTITYPLATESAAGAALGDGVVIGLLNGTWAMGQVVAPLLAGAVAQLVGTRPAYLVAVVPGAVAALWLLARRGATGVAHQPEAPADHSPPATSEHELGVARG
jgi:predicted MFS family arabinose efflux permease